MTGLIFPSLNSWKTSLTTFFTYSEPSCWYSKWRKLNPVSVLFSSNSLMGETLSTCHHCKAKSIDKSVNYFSADACSYRASNAEEALGFAGNDVRWSEEDVLAHRLEQTVAAVAVIAAQAIQDDVDSLWRDPGKEKWVLLENFEKK